MVEEFMKYKKDTEEAVTKTIAEMRDRLELRAKEKQVLEEERDRMSGLLSKLQGQINELEGQVSQSVIQIQVNWANRTDQCIEKQVSNQLLLVRASLR